VNVLDDINTLVDRLGPMPPEIRETTAAVQHTQTKVYPKRKARTPAHLKRMNKKWLKRYGSTATPAAFLMNCSALGHPGKQILFVHPTLMALIPQMRDDRTDAFRMMFR
jgi:hypothetical protein